MKNGGKRYPTGRIVPVIHLLGTQQAVESAGIAAEENVGGVFLKDIKASTRLDAEVLAEACAEVATAYPDLWVGAYAAADGKDAAAALEIFSEIGIDGVLHENALGWPARQWLDPKSLETLVTYKSLVQEKCEASITFFGGISMRGSGYLEDPRDAVRMAEFTQDAVDVVTTSGKTSDEAPELSRVQRMLFAIDTQKHLAVVGGINQRNILPYLRFSDFLLPDIAIEASPYSGMINTEKLKILMKRDSEFETFNE